MPPFGNNFLAVALVGWLAFAPQQSPVAPVAQQQAPAAPAQQAPADLVEHVIGLEKWPRLLTWQVVDMAKLRGEPVSEAVAVLRQSPILYISGKDAPLALLNDPQAHAVLRDPVPDGNRLGDDVRHVLAMGDDVGGEGSAYRVISGVER